LFLRGGRKEKKRGRVILFSGDKKEEEARYWQILDHPKKLYLGSGLVKV
jgi:hypothetical protein